MKIFLIIQKADQVIGDNNHTYDLLQSSAELRGLECVRVSSQKDLYLNTVEKGDLVYRINAGPYYKALENELILQGAFSLSYPERHMITWSIYASEYRGTQFVPQFRLLDYDTSIIGQMVLHLEGYPVVVKRMGGSHGEGITLHDSEEDLLNYLKTIDLHKESVYLKKYIETNGHIRVVVLGNEVLGAVKYMRPKDDFRTNASDEILVEVVSVTQDIKDVSIKAIHDKDHVFGGVDIIMDGNTPLVMESNIPCYFPRVQDAIGVDISGAIIDYLIQKSQSHIN